MHLLIQELRHSMKEKKGGRNMFNRTTVESIKEHKKKKENPSAVVIKRLYHNKVAMTGLFIFIILIVISAISPWIMPYPYEKMDVANAFSPPSSIHIFGTDELGRDIFSRILYGGRASLSLSVFSIALGTGIAIILGSIAGYFGGIIDNVIMRFIDIIQAIPGMLLAIAISSALGTGFTKTVMALAVGSIPMNVRLLRASILSIRKQEYLEAATSINCSKGRIIMKYVLPNSMAPLIVSVTMGIGNTLLMAAALSYIGLGVQPPTPEWGAMLSSGRNYIRDYPHLVIFPGIIIMITVLSLNMLGDGLRDALDPKLKN